MNTKRKKTGRRVLSFLLTLAMVVGLMPGMSLTAYAAGVSYVDGSGTSQTVEATVLEAATTNWNNGSWYIVPENGVTISGRIAANGTVNLILRDGATLTASAGIRTTGATLNIYAQSAGTGALTATGNNGGGTGETGGSAGIGGDGVGYERSGGAGGTVNIYGGKVTATGGNGGEYASGGAGIGGGGMGTSSNEGSGAGGTVSIYGGTVIATGGNGGDPDYHVVDGVGIGAGGKGFYGSGSSGTLTLGEGVKLYNGTDNTGSVLDDSDSESRIYSGSRVKTMFAELLTHEHDFSYSASGATITATCSNTDGNCTLPESSSGVGDHVATLTIGAPLHTAYGDGKSTAAVITDTNNIKGDAVVSYYSATKDGDTYSKSPETPLGLAPEGIGDYIAEITIGGATAFVGYSITKQTNTTEQISTETLSGNITKSNTSITIGSTSSAYEYIVVAKDATPVWTGAQAGNGNTLTFNGLSAGTGYDVYVRAKGDDNTEPGEATKVTLTTNVTVAISGTPTQGQGGITVTTEPEKTGVTYRWYIGTNSEPDGTGTTIVPSQGGGVLKVDVLLGGDVIGTATTGETTVKTLAEVITDSTTSPVEITLDGPVKGGISIPAGKEVTLNIKGQEVGGGISVPATSTLTINDTSTPQTGTVKGTVAANTGTVIIKGGRYDTLPTATNPGTVTIQGGLFKEDPTTLLHSPYEVTTSGVDVYTHEVYNAYVELKDENKPTISIEKANGNTDTNTPQIGDTLKVVTTAKPVTYQWKRKAANGDETQIENATGSTYTLTSDDVGATITVTVTQTKDENNDNLSESRTQSSSATATVEKKSNPKVKVATNDFFNNISKNGSSISINSTSTDYEYAVVEKGTTPGWTNSDSKTGTGNTLSFTGLSGGTDYDVYVRAKAYGDYQPGEATKIIVSTDVQVMIGDTPEQGQAVNVTLTPNKGGVTYKWYVVDGETTTFDGEGETIVPSTGGKKLKVEVYAGNPESKIGEATTTGNIKTIADVISESNLNPTAITLAGNISGGITIPESKNVVLALNGHEIGGGITVEGTSTLTINDSSTPQKGTVKGVVAAGGGTVTINGGRYYETPTKGDTGTLTIRGGLYKNTPADLLSVPYEVKTSTDTDYTYEVYSTYEALTTDNKPSITMTKATGATGNTDNTKPQIGDTLNAITTAKPVSYKWYRNGQEIGGQTASTYTLTEDDTGKAITVTITQSIDENGNNLETPLTQTSTATAAVVKSDVQAVSDVETLINNLPEVGAATVSNRKAIEEAQAAYEALTDTQKGKVHTDKIIKLAMLEVAAKTSGMTYTGNPIQLINEPTTALPTGYTMYYAIGDDATKAPDFDGTSQNENKKWSTSIPTATDAGTYYVWYMVKGDAGHSSTEPVAVEVKIRKIEIKSIRLRAISGTTMVPGTSQQLEAILTPSEATADVLTWTSSDTGIATVEGGRVTIKPNDQIAWGDRSSVQVTITAAADKAVSSITILVKNVDKAVTGINIDSKAVRPGLKPGDTFRLTAEIAPYDATDKTVTWTSSDTDVAEIGPTGIVTIKGFGKTTITVVATNGNKDTLELEIGKTAVTGVTINPVGGDDYLVVGSSTRLTAAVEPDDASVTDIQWSSSDDTVATVDESGTVKGLKSGRVTIAATSKDDGTKKATQEFIVFESEDSLYVEFEDGPDYTYTGKAITPTVNVYYRGKQLLRNTDYTVSYKNNKNANAATNIKKAPKVVVNGKTVAAKAEAMFRILPIDIGDETLVSAQEIYITPGKTATPILYFGGTQLKSRNTYSDGIKIGSKNIENPFEKTKFNTSRAITVYGVGNFTGKREIWVNVKSAAEVKKVPSIKIKSFKPVKRYYNGKPQVISANEITVVSSADRKKVKTPLVMNKDFYIAYPNDNTNVGTVKIAIIGMGDYAGYYSRSYRIEAAKYDSTSVESISINFPYREGEKEVGGTKYDTFTYKPTGVKPYAEVRVSFKNGQTQTLSSGSDYTVTYKNFRKAGAANKDKPATATISFRGNYKNLKKLTKDFYITQAKLSEANILLQNKVTTKAQPNYLISAPIADIGGDKINKSEYTVTYKVNGSDITGRSKLYKQLTEGESITVDVEVKAKSDKNGKEIYNYTGTQKGKYLITRINEGQDLSKAKVIIKKKGDSSFKNVGKLGFTGNRIVIGKDEYSDYELYVYMGKNVKDPAKKELKEGVDYTVSYSNNVNAGKATIILNAKDGSKDFYGSKTFNFNIVKGKMRWVK